MSNTVTALKDWLGEGTRPVSTKEMMEFWKSLSEEDKEEFKHAELS